jgi:hypothetical protein
MHPPLGTRVFEGAAGPQVSTGVGAMSHGHVSNIFAGRLEGGAQQVYINDPGIQTLRSLIKGDKLTVTPMRPVTNSSIDLPGAG